MVFLRILVFFYNSVSINYIFTRINTENTEPNLDTNMTSKSKPLIKSQITEYFFKILLYAILIYLAFIQPTKSIKIGILFPPLNSNDGKIVKHIPPLLEKVHNLSAHIHKNNFELIFQEQPPYGKRIGAFNGALNLCQNHSVDVIIWECWKWFC